MNRIRYIYGIIIVVAVCSCQKDIDALPNYIEFGAIHKFVLRSAETRAATNWGGETTADFNGTMKLYGMYDGTGASTFINGDNVEVTGGQNTTYKKVWPNATSTYKFFAFYPSDAMTVATDASNLKCTVNAASGYTIGANASTHKDLMYASRENPTHGAKFDLVFHHLLTRVTFQVSRATDFPEKEIESITLTGVRDTYKGETQSGSTEDEVGADSKFTWTRVGNTTNSPCMNATNTPGSPSIFPYKLTTTSTLLNDNFFLFPQTVSESGKEIKLQLKLKDEATPIEVDLSDTGIDWGMGEWINYVITFEKDGVTIAAEVKPWTTLGVDGNIINRKLNVSDTEAEIFYRTVGTADSYKIYFWTDQKENVYIERYGYKGDEMGDESPTLKFDVNTVFNSISGTNSEGSNIASATNFEFDSSTGSGCITLKPITTTTNVGRIVLNAGGLRKEILTAAVYLGTPPPSPATLYPYVGAFWRADETGERLIRMPVASDLSLGTEDIGKWKAIVGDENDGKDWIRLDTKVSGEGSEYWKTPFTPVDEDNTAYQVNNGKTMVSGTATTSEPIYFRIGLTSELESGEAPRYGVVYLTYSDYSKVHKIYVRQGEAPDYIASGNSDSKKWSPYNLTAKSWVDIGGNTTQSFVQIYKRGTNTGGTDEADFVAYPSMAGAAFQWAQTESSWQRRAFNMGVVYWDNSSGLWDDRHSAYKDVGWNGELNETCPVGYRRPNIVHGPDMYPPSLRTEVSDGNEAYQSLMTWNKLFGYYADGYFDRQKVENPLSGIEYEGNGQKIEYSLVAGGTKDVACIGRLFHNSSSSASIFFPATGRRNHKDGKLWSAGSMGFYMSQNKSQRDHVIRDKDGNIIENLGTLLICHLRFNSSWAVTLEAQNVPFANPVRCVKE